VTSTTDAIWVNHAKKAILLIRILVGWIFLSEGIQKFLFPEALGVGRFAKIGIPLPQLMAPFIGVTEIICGALLIVGLFTRLACVPCSSTFASPCTRPRSSRSQRTGLGVAA
jgi:uncharacterized membrane protein YphA (DoxX/SURF4 family)